MNFGLYLLLNLLFLFALALWLRTLVVKRLKPETILADLESEVNTMIQDLNAAGDQNVSLLEDRIETLRELIHRADLQIDELEEKVRTLETRHIEQHVEVDRDDGIQEYPAVETQESSEGDVHPHPVEPSVEEEAPIIFPFRRESAAEEAETPRQAVLRLHGQGVSSELIASRTGIAIGEVELIISLGSRRVRQ